MEKNKKLETLIEELQGIKLAKNHLAKIQTRLNKEQVELIRLEKILKKEYADVLKAKKNLSGLFSKFLKEQKDQYEIEKQEYLFAALKYNEHLKSVELLEFEEKILSEKVTKETEVKNELAVLVAERNSNIDLKYPNLSLRLKGLNQQHDEQFSFKKELHEALIAAAKAENVLSKMLKMLEQCANFTLSWGQYTSSTRIKFEAIMNEAHQLSYVAKQLLLDLEEEMSDIYAHKSILRMHRFEEFRLFSDIYFDSLITDWVVKKRLTSARGTVAATLNMVQRLSATLNVQMQKTEQNLLYLEKRRKEIISESF